MIDGGKFAALKLRNIERRNAIERRMNELRAEGARCDTCRYFLRGFCFWDRERGQQQTKANDLCLHYRKRSPKPTTAS